MKQTARQTAQWILAFATALIFCSPFFLRGGPKAAAGAVLQTTAPAAAPDAAWRPNDDKAGGVSAPRYNGVERASRYITLKDGVRLALDVYLPKRLEAGARLPTMLEQTRYNRSYEFQPEVRDKADHPSQKITEFVTRGYAYVVVDVRGSGASFGNRRVDYSAGTGNQSRWNTLVRGGPVDYPDRAAEDGKLLTYTSAPLEQDMEVTGHPVARLFVSSTAPDGQFFVYLEEVDEEGRVRYVTEGQLRAINRKISDARPPYKTFGPYHTFLRRDARPLVPGQVAELSFDLLPTSNLFRKGRRIRIAIAGADKDHFEPPAGDPPTVRVYRGGVHASRIDLPVTPRK